MNIVENIKALRKEITSRKSMSQIIRVSSTKDKYSVIDDLCVLALKYLTCGYEHKAARCYLYALAALKSIKSKIIVQRLILEKAYAKRSDKVTVAGDFNNWNVNSLPMICTEDSLVIDIPLEKGKQYQFRYVRNGNEWFNDAKHTTITNSKGEKNMLLKT